MAPVKVFATKTVAADANIGVGNCVGVAVGISAGVGIGVGETGVSPAHADIPAISTASAKGDIDRGHRYMRGF